MTTKVQGGSSIASRWRELSGDKGWDGLLHPLDLDLRRYVIHYGERATSVGDLYDLNKDGGCPKEEFFAKACLEKGNNFKYSVTHYIHASSAWFGFVAVTTDEGKAVLGRRDILIAWRGTITPSEWVNNFRFFRTSASGLFGDGTEALVHSGFLSLYTGPSSDSADSKSARIQVRDALTELMNKYPDEELSITVIGFSLGAALATLNAMDIANGYNEGEKKSPCTVTAFTYGSPRVGNDGLKKEYERLVDHNHLRLLRITNANDPVHNMPKSGYTHLGKELQINTSNSPYLKWSLIGAAPYVSSVNPESVPSSDGITIEEEMVIVGGVGEYFSAHTMDVYLHGIAGVQEGSEFRLEAGHDIALVNKHLDRLKDEHGVPTNWWKGENRKKMVQKDDGHWEVITP